MENNPTIKGMGLAAAAMTFLGVNLSPAQAFHRKRGKAPAGKKWVNSSAYVPGGANPNVRGTYIKNPLIQEHVRMMHETWLAMRAERLEGMAAKRALKEAANAGA